MKACSYSDSELAKIHVAINTGDIVDDAQKQSAIETICSVLAEGTERLGVRLYEMLMRDLVLLGVETRVGYVDGVDEQRKFVHIYDFESRHFVAIDSPIILNKECFVRFVPVFPKNGRFKKAVVLEVVGEHEGVVEFGLRRAYVSHVDVKRGFFCYEFADEQPLFETGSLDSKEFVSGFVSLPKDEDGNVLLDSVPEEGNGLHLVVFLKRGKDGEKRPHVVRVYMDED